MRERDIRKEFLYMRKKDSRWGQNQDFSDIVSGLQKLH